MSEVHLVYVVSRDGWLRRLVRKVFRIYRHEWVWAACSRGSVALGLASQLHDTERYERAFVVTKVVDFHG